VVLEIGSDAGQVVNHLDSLVPQVLAGPDSRKLQQMRGAERTARDNDLAARMGGLQPEGVDTRCHGAPVLQQHPGRVRAGLDGQIRSGARWVQIGRGGAPAAFVVGRGLVIAASLLRLSIEVLIFGNPACLQACSSAWAISHSYGWLDTRNGPPPP